MGNSITKLKRVKAPRKRLIEFPSNKENFKSPGSIVVTRGKFRVRKEKFNKDAPISLQPMAVQPSGPAQANEEKIRRKAYELYVQRGYQHGYDREDWFEAQKLCST